MPRHRKVNFQIKRIREFIASYEITEQMLAQFKIIAPAIYNHIDSICDFNGRPVSVYVKFAPRAELPATTLATTNIDQLPADEHAYYSHYGIHTVSIKIAIANNSLLILAHEFGHISYQVPNLASYVDLASRLYRNDSAGHGHNPHDPSGRSALRFEKRFQQYVLQHKQMKNRGVKNPATVIDSIGAVLTKN